MSILTLSFAAKAMNAVFNQNQDCVIKDVKTDSRQVSKGTLFVAIPGARVDGHDFIRAVEAQGAIGIVASKPVATTLPTLLVSDTIQALGQFAKAYRDTFQLPIVAITGSCGKTTVKEMLSTILNEVGPVLFPQGNLNTDVGVPLTLLRLLPEHQYAVIEMGARKKEDIRYLMGLVSPQVAMITNVGIAHRAMFGGEEEIAKAKGEIFECLPANGVAIINAEDKYADYWHGLLKNEQKVLTFGIEDSNAHPNIFGENIVLEQKNSSFELQTDIGSIVIHLNIPGLHMVQNAIAAAAAARALGISLLNIKSGLEKFSPIAGRLQFKKGRQGVSIVDDTYNASPISIRAALMVLTKLSGKQIFVMGDMVNDMFEKEDEAQKLHYDIGRDAKNWGVHKMFGVGPLTAFAIEAFGENGQHYPDKETLIKALQLELKPDTTILVKGSRFMQMEEIVLALTTDCQETSSC